MWHMCDMREMWLDAVMCCGVLWRNAMCCYMLCRTGLAVTRHDEMRSMCCDMTWQDAFKYAVTWRDGMRFNHLWRDLSFPLARFISCPNKCDFLKSSVNVIDYVATIRYCHRMHCITLHCTALHCTAKIIKFSWNMCRHYLIQQEEKCWGSIIFQRTNFIYKTYSRNTNKQMNSQTQKKIKSIAPLVADPSRWKFITKKNPFFFLFTTKIANISKPTVQFQKSRIRERISLSMCEDSSTDTKKKMGLIQWKFSQIYASLNCLSCFIGSWQRFL